MIILTSAQAQEVAGVTVIGHALAPVALKDGSFALPDAVLADPRHEPHHTLLSRLPQRAVLPSEVVTDED